jgi:hypothetical protein
VVSPLEKCAGERSHCGRDATPDPAKFQSGLVDKWHPFDAQPPKLAHLPQHALQSTRPVTLFHHVPPGPNGTFIQSEGVGVGVSRFVAPNEGEGVGDPLTLAWGVGGRHTPHAGANHIMLQTTSPPSVRAHGESLGLPTGSSGRKTSSMILSWTG